MTAVWRDSSPNSTVLIVLAALGGVGAAGCSCGASVLDTARNRDDAGGAGKTSDSGHDGITADATGTAPDAYSEEFGVQSRSGSQIAVLGFSSGDATTGAADPALRDKKHGVDCSIRLATDGTTRCLPESNVIVFTDASCTKPIAIDTVVASCGNSDPPTYGIEYWGGDTVCARSRSSAYELGAPTSSPSAVYQQSIFGCVQRTPPRPETYRAATLTPLDDWVKFERETTKVTSELGVSSWHGSDESRWVHSLVLLPQNTLCSGATQGGPAARCVPSDRLVRSTSAGLFGDSACRETLAGRCEPNPALIENFDPNSPPSSRCAALRFPEVGQLFQVGRELDHSAIYLNLGSECGLTPDGQALNFGIIGSFLYYAAGAPVRFEDYPIVGQTFSGTGRLQQISYVAEDGAKLYTAPAVFYDTVANADCHGEDLLSDGRIVCVPQHALAEIVGGRYDGFADPACTKYLAFDSCASAQGGVKTEERQSPTGETLFCGISLHRASLHSGPIYSSSNGACLPEPQLPQTYTVYEQGDQVEPETLFPRLDRVDL